ncbi:hypothetical protein SBA6_930003 [Candidatus Sulfopaludibacter sp. SbA6]|nr:hypothetical protein SBA6_930003 [Candidatus Sulfopaludibacter sp. SbA6]
MPFFRRNEHAQDLAEYCLLVALIALIALGLMAHFAGGIQGIWNSASTTLASGSSSGDGSGPPGGGQSGGPATADRGH